MLTVIVLHLLFFLSPAMAANCGTWNPVVVAAPTSGNESGSLTISWTNPPPGACANPPAPPGDNWDGTNKLTLRRAEGGTPPATRTSGTLVANLAASATSYVDTMNRSDKEYSYALFACEMAFCVSSYGDGTGSHEVLAGNTVTDRTDPELWSLTDITGPSDVTSVAVDDLYANAPHVFFYPSDWSLALGNRMAMYYSTSAMGGASDVYYTINGSTGWPTTLNDPTSWAAATQVVQGSTTSTDHDYNADHPWAMLTSESGVGRRVQLFVQSQDRTHKEAIQIESADEVGDDFGLGCSAGTCSSTIIGSTIGYVAIDADGTSATDYVYHAQHSRVGWAYLNDPYIDTSSDHPFMMFQMKRPSSGSCADTGPYDDIARAEGSWNGTSWDWEVVTDGGSPDCPVVQVADGHDNSIVPLPGVEYKMYYKSYNDEHWYVTYWDGTTWDDAVQIQFYWYGSTTTGPSHDCIENVSALVYQSGGTAYSAMAFMLKDGDDCGDGLDDEGTVVQDDAAIVFAELAN